MTRHWRIRERLKFAARVRKERETETCPSCEGDRYYEVRVGLNKYEERPCPDCCSDEDGGTR